MSTTFNLQFSGSLPSEDEAAAISAALAALLAEQAASTAPPVQLNPWHDSGKLVQQGLAPLKLGAAPTWSRIERLRRHVSGGFYGIVGL